MRELSVDQWFTLKFTRRWLWSVFGVGFHSRIQFHSHNTAGPILEIDHGVAEIRWESGEEWHTVEDYK